MFNSTIEIIIALSAAGVGGGIIRLIEIWLGKSRAKNTQDRELRDELRTNATALRAEIDALKAELKETEKMLDHWREQYWEIFMKLRMFQLEVRTILIKNGINPDDVLSEESKPEMGE